MCQYTCVSAYLLCVKLKKLVCAHTVACNFGVHMIASEHMRHTNDAQHELALGLPHYICGAYVQQTHIDNEIH